VPDRIDGARAEPQRDRKRLGERSLSVVRGIVVTAQETLARLLSARHMINY
jgi:hypothetical protein